MDLSLFAPISTENIYQAAAEIDREGVGDRPSTTYDMILDTKRYPPKLVISIAYRYATGEELHHSAFHGGEGKPAFEFLRQKGFTIIPKKAEIVSNSRFTWVPYYEEMCRKLGNYTSTQLIGFLKDLQIDGLRDKDKDGNEFELTDIDPLTFVSFLNKFGDSKRIQILALVRDLLKLSTPAPTDVAGLPSSQAQSVWLFGYQYNRRPDDIEQLRTLYNQIHAGGVTAHQYNHVLTIFKVGRAKLTEAMFYQQPTIWLPINSKTKPYLHRKGLPIHYDAFGEYVHILELVREKDNDLSTRSRQITQRGIKMKT